MSGAHGAGELVLATLYLEPTEERAGALRAAAAGLERWDEVLVALEAHGVLGLALRNLVAARAAVPAPVRERLEQRAAVMRSIDAAFRITLERFLAEAARERVEVTLLKGAALALDLYPEPGLRTQSDLDLLVRDGHVSAAVAAAQRIGLALPARALPVWWQRLVHFHLKLEPLDGLQREIELHWHLHHPARLHTVRLEDLLARRQSLHVGGLAAWTLDPLDRLLHLVTHLLRHAPLDGLDRPALGAWAVDPRVPLRLKWLVDIRAEIERRHAELDGGALAARAREWNAEDELGRMLPWLRAELPLAPAADDWAARVVALLPARAPVPRRAPALDRPLPGLDLRASALREFPRWVWPRADDLAPARRGVAPRVAHAAHVLARGGVAAVALPVAAVAGLTRRRPAAAALGPVQALELAARARELARAAQGPTSS